jgi:hypothetical protein
MWKRILIAVIGIFALVDQAASQSVRGAFTSPSIQILPMMVGAEKGFYKREGLHMELVFVRGAFSGVCRRQAQLVPPMELASPQAIIFKETTENSSSSTSPRRF